MLPVAARRAAQLAAQVVLTLAVVDMTARHGR